MKKIKYNVDKSYKMIKAMEPDNIDRILLWLFLILGLYFYYSNPSYEALLSLLGFGFIYELMLHGCWFIHFLVHAIYCKIKKVPFKGNGDKSQDNTQDNL